jgi:hypothetical protein
VSFTSSKSIFKSLGIQGIVVALIPTLLKLFGVDLGADSAGLISNFVELGFEFVGSAMAIYGRIRASQTLHL